ncbi:MAG: nuclear transport factor 2 family protein [Tahibacter sp.]
MRTIRALLLATLGVATLSATGGYASSADSKDVEDLIATDKRMQRAFVDRDIQALEEIFTDDYVLVVASGDERSKAQILDSVKSPETHWEINETRDWKVRVHGDMAIVVAMLHQKGIDHGQSFDSNVKFSDTYIREKGRWRNMHLHASRAINVADPAG